MKLIHVFIYEYALFGGIVYGMLTLIVFVNGIYVIVTLFVPVPCMVKDLNFIRYITHEFDSDYTFRAIYIYFNSILFLQNGVFN